MTLNDLCVSLIHRNFNQSRFINPGSPESRNHEVIEFFWLVIEELTFLERHVNVQGIKVIKYQKTGF